MLTLWIPVIISWAGLKAKSDSMVWTKKQKISWHKLAFIERKGGNAISHTPQLHQFWFLIPFLKIITQSQMLSVGASKLDDGFREILRFSLIYLAPTTIWINGCVSLWKLIHNSSRLEWSSQHSVIFFFFFCICGVSKTTSITDTCRWWIISADGKQAVLSQHTCRMLINTCVHVIITTWA